MTDTPQERIKRNAEEIAKFTRHLSEDQLGPITVEMIRLHCSYILAACDEIEKSV